MRFSWSYLPLILAAASPGLACSTDLGDGGPPIDGGVSGPDAVLRFEPQGTLELAPGEERAVGVVGSPPARYEVSFSLVGEAAGAWLDRTKVVADAGGRAAVTLHAPSVASTFRLRATLKEGPSAEIGASVSEKGFGTVRVIPRYDGHRQASEWTASVKAGTTCAAIAARLPEEPEGALVATAPADEPGGVEITSAPVGPNLAVAIRAGRAMWGCVNVPDLAAGKEREVEVAVKDGPIDLPATSLDLSLAFTPTAGVSALLEATTTRLVDAFLPENDEAAALLDAMAMAVPSDMAEEFAEQRAQMDWDGLTANHLEAAGQPLREVCRGWTAAGLAALPAEITGQIQGIADVPGKAWLEVTALGGVSAEDAGVPPTAHQMSWSADPGDVLRLTGILYWVPSRYAGAAAWVGAQEALPGATSVAQALGEVAGCEALGADLGGYAGCDALCLAALCQAALAARWEAALDASALAGLAGTVAIAASGPGAVDQEAVPVAWNAAWLGKISDGETEATVEGQAEAAAPMVGLE